MARAKKEVIAITQEVNMFDSAPVVVVKSAAAEKEAKNKTREVALGDKLDYLAAINALTDSLAAVKEVYYKEVTAEMADSFTDEAMKIQKRPTNFRGIGNESEASCELRKRASTSKLSDEEVAILKEHNIKYDEAIVSEGIDEQFFFNPALLEDKTIAGLISKKLSEIPELAGKQVIMKQAKREKTTKNIVAEESFDQIAKLQDRTLVKQLLSIVSVLGVKPKLTTQDLDTVLDLVRKSGVKL